MLHPRAHCMQGRTLIACSCDPFAATGDGHDRRGTAETLASKPAAPLTMGHFLAYRDAIAFARRIHAGQKRLDGRTFVSHPIAVLQILLTACPHLPQAAARAALLHDAVEDGRTSDEEVRAAFGRDTADAVAALTRSALRKGEDAIDHERAYLDQIVRSNACLPYVMLIKMADRIHNLETAHYLPVERQDALLAQTDALYLPLLRCEEGRQIAYAEAYRLLLAQMEESVKNLVPKPRTHFYKRE